jgi:hypothetical protein
MDAGLDFELAPFAEMQMFVSFRQGCVTARGPGCYFQSAAEVGEIEGYECHSCG